jgi:all-trans-retinol 13,14-reductase
MISTIERAGGKVMTQRRVTEILIESGTATGVKAQNAAHPDLELIYHAPIIVSNAGAFNTYLNLIPPDVRSSDKGNLLEAIRAFPKGDPLLTLYLGLKESSQKLGFEGENHWVYDTYDHEKAGEVPPIERDNLPLFCYLSFPSLKNPTAKGYTAEIISSAHYDMFTQWQSKTWRKRGDDYSEIKPQISESLIQFVESHYPGFQDLIEYAELSTPLTTEHFNSSDRGSIYGIPCIPERLEQSWIAASTPIKNLYLTGTDTFSLGIVGSMMGGVKTACMINGRWGFVKILANVIFPATDPTHNRKSALTA